MKVLINRYHPCVEDMASSFARHLKFKVDVSVNIRVNDQYGSHLNILNSLKSQEDLTGFNAISLNEAIVRLKTKQYDICFVDGVYDGDKDLIAICKQQGIPYICIAGYPYLRDEDAKNILSFSWFMPQFQYVQQYPTEGHVKEVAHAKLLNGEQNKKNTFVWYPEFAHAKQYAKQNPRFLANCRDYSSFIHRYEECNKSLYDIFITIKNNLERFTVVENYSGFTNTQVLTKMTQSKGLLHIKGFDAPGISLIEAMLVGCTPFLFQEFILGSFNQEILIDNYSCVLADSIAEMIENLESDKWAKLSKTTQEHAMMITSFERQQNKLEKFIEMSLKNV